MVEIVCRVRVVGFCYSLIFADSTYGRDWTERRWLATRYNALPKDAGDLDREE